MDTATLDIVSDHFPIMATLNFEIPSATHKPVTFRQINKIGPAQFKSDVTESEQVMNPAHTSATTFYKRYHSVMGDLLDRHAPVSTKSCSSTET